MLSSALVSFLLTNNYPNGFHKIRRKGVTWAIKETIRFFGCNPDHITLGLRLRLDGGHVMFYLYPAFV